MFDLIAQVGGHGFVTAQIALAEFQTYAESLGVAIKVEAKDTKYTEPTLRLIVSNPDSADEYAIKRLVSDFCEQRPDIAAYVDISVRSERIK